MRFSEAKIIYVGQTNAKNQPHGHGYMYVTSGDVHEGAFENGRAHGPGIVVGTNGSEMTGTWDQNKRVGAFRVAAKDGVFWSEKYNPEGKKIARKKEKKRAPVAPDTPDTEDPGVIDELVPPDPDTVWQVGYFHGQGQ